MRKKIIRCDQCEIEREWNNTVPELLPDGWLAVMDSSGNLLAEVCGWDCLSSFGEDRSGVKSPSPAKLPRTVGYGMCTACSGTGWPKKEEDKQEDKPEEKRETCPTCMKFGVTHNTRKRTGEVSGPSNDDMCTVCMGFGTHRVEGFEGDKSTKKIITCATCKGTGVRPEVSEKPVIYADLDERCVLCQGRGWHDISRIDGDVNSIERWSCHHCDGTGNRSGQVEVPVDGRHEGEQLSLGLGAEEVETHSSSAT